MQTRTPRTRAVALSEQGLRHTTLAAHRGRHRETIGLWLKGLATYGLRGFLERQAPAKKGPRRARQVPPTIQRVMWALRTREHACCGQQIAYCLERAYHVRLSGPTIDEMLAEQDVSRSTWHKNQKRGAGPTASCARAVLPRDTVACGHRFAFTGIDLDPKEAEVVLRPARTRAEGVACLPTAMTRRGTGRVEGLHTDGGPECNGAVAPQVRA